MLQANADRAEYDQTGRAWLAYHIGVMNRAEKPPTFNQLLGRKDERRPMSQAEIANNLRAWARWTQQEFGRAGARRVQDNPGGREGA